MTQVVMPAVRVGRLFQTWLYHPALAGTPPEEGNWNHFGGLFPTPLYHGSVFGELSRTAELAERPTSMQACP